MSDVPNRSALEASLARALAKLSKAQQAALLKELGDPPSLSNVSDTFWARYGAELTSALNTVLQRVYEDQAVTLGKDYAVTGAVDWSLVNRDAADWAAQYTFDLVRGITETTQTQLQDIISTGIEQSQTLEQVQSAIQDSLLFSPVRAEMIAVTELTRAAAEGESAMVATLGDTGVDLRATWNTAEDEHVCSICGSLDQQQAGDDGNFTDDEGNTYDMPPAHPRCRCGLGWTLKK